jgi:hypothetical protein
LTSFRQLEANRRNALRSTGPRTEQGKRRSRLNAVRHGLTAETVVANLEDAEDYKAFEATIIADYCAETAVARELVLRLASLLWRLRRATAIETDLFELHAEMSPDRQADETQHTNKESHVVVRPFRGVCRQTSIGRERQPDEFDHTDADYAQRTRHMTYSFLRLANDEAGVFERLNRYEAALWRQAVQIIFTLHPIKLR